MSYIKVWCEYDFGSQFGGNYEDVFLVMSKTKQEDIDGIVLEYLSEKTGIESEELEGLCDWDYITIEGLC